MHRLWTVGFLLALPTAARATSQCEPYHGSKSPIIDVIGWAILWGGVVLGVAVLVYAVRRSRDRVGCARVAVVLVGIVGMGLAAFVGLAVAFMGFFMQC